VSQPVVIVPPVVGSKVAIVTDSTAYLPNDIAAAGGVTVVPVEVVIGGTPHDEGTEISPADVAQALRDFTPVTTSRISPQRMADVYREIAAAGAEAIVSVHLSSSLSGTYHSAVLAADECTIPVLTVDSRTIGMGLGFPVLHASDVAAAGGSVEDIAQAATKAAAAGSTYFYVDTLEYLRRGGRINARSALIGSALAVKPILSIVGGEVAALERVRTASRALARLEELTVAAAGPAQVDVAVGHLESLERAETLAESLADRLDIRRLVVHEVGAVVGAHVGPGMVSTAVVPVETEAN
jgi:DegV family protein with EDD domain